MKKKNYPLTILISVKGKYISIAVVDIIHLEAHGNNTMVYVRRGKSFLDSKKIGKFYLQLNPILFFRSSRSFVVNISEVSEFEKARSGEILMSNGKKVRFSARKKNEFIQRMMGK